MKSKYEEVAESFFGYNKPEEKVKEEIKKELMNWLEASDQKKPEADKILENLFNNPIFAKEKEYNWDSAQLLKSRWINQKTREKFVDILLQSKNSEQLFPARGIEEGWCIQKLLDLKDDNKFIEIVDSKLNRLDLIEKQEENNKNQALGKVMEKYSNILDEKYSLTEKYNLFYKDEFAQKQKFSFNDFFLKDGTLITEEFGDLVKAKFQALPNNYI